MPADAMSFVNVLQVLSGQFWSHFQFDVSHILYLLICTLPLIVYANQALTVRTDHFL